MKPASSDTAQTSFLLPDLEKQLDPRSLLYRLAQAIDWKGFEKTFGSLYSTEKGSVPHIHIFFSFSPLSLYTSSAKPSSHSKLFFDATTSSGEGD
jgi:hypothetical protein